jgi:EAL domain-containing protein (putative c-di-GMP-specific phosphodiesterase class I)/RimJ/RimL family protein N-acetyltransferase
MLNPENHQKLAVLFESQAEEILLKAKKEPSATGFSEKLWSLPKAVLYYCCKVVTAEEKALVVPTLRKLRGHSAKLIDELPETVTWKNEIRQRINNAKAQFTFRQWSLNDLDDFISHLDDEDMWRYIPQDYPNPLTREMASSLIGASNEVTQRHKVHAVQWSGKPIGQARLLFDSTYPDAAEISYWLGKEHWGKGLTSDFVTLYTLESFHANPHINCIYAKVLDGNSASIKLLEKAGYRHEFFEHQNVEKYGELRNTHILSIYRASYRCFLDPVVDIQAGLKQHIHNHAFNIHFQPIINLHNDQNIGFEALIRWPVNEYNYLPDEFLPIAEKNADIYAIGNWVIDKAIAQISIWQKTHAKERFIAINISPVQLQNRSVTEYIIDRAEAYSVNPKNIVLEITETALSEKQGIIKKSIEALSDYGFIISLDGFGVGLSSISHLIDFPISIVKLDKSLFTVKHSQEKRKAVFEAFAAMLKRLKIIVVVEGIETQAHLDMCKSLEIDHGQGFFLGRPATAETFEKELS